MPLLALLAVCLLLGSCGVVQTPYRKDGKLYGVTAGAFRDKWWHYYERGLSFAQGEFYPEAMRDLAAAAQRRPDDQWRARTYGMHFVDYFPHRELGIVHYRQGHFAAAIRELETSQAATRSAKAAYFLNRARAALLRQTGHDRQPPAVRLLTPAARAVTRGFFSVVSGTATDDQFVSAITVNGSPLLVEQSAPHIPFHTRLSLREGTNVIRVRVEDLTGKVTSESVSVVADRRGPVISVLGWESRGGGARLAAHLSDATGIAEVRLNGRRVLVPGGQEVDLIEELPPGPVRIEARDVAGNLTQAVLPAAQKARLPVGWPRFAALGSVFFVAPPRWQRCSGVGRPVERLAAPGGGAPPQIQLRDPPAGSVTHLDQLLIEGRVHGAAAVTSLTVNGRQLLRREGETVFFSQLLALSVGRNRIEIEAQDRRGRVGRRHLIVERKVPKIRQLGSRMSIALPGLRQLGPVSVVGRAADDRLLNAFVAQARFRVVERQQLQAVLHELRLGASGLVDPTSAPRLGRTVAADTVLTGTVAETERSIEIVTHLVDSETATVLATNDAYDEVRSLPALHTLAERLAFKYKRNFPLLEGRILEVVGGQLVLDLGGQDGLRLHQKLLLFRSSPTPQPVLDLGEATVAEVFPEHARATVTRSGAVLRAADGVLTK